MDVQTVETGHKDLIHDVAYDYFATRVATCSSDLTIKVFDLIGDADESSSIGIASLTGATAPTQSHITDSKFSAVNPNSSEVGEMNIALPAGLGNSRKSGLALGASPLSSTENSANRWVLNNTWKAADASIVKLAWAQPEFGQILAAASLDRTVRIFEEIPHLNAWDMSESAGTRWVERAKLVDFQEAVLDAAFAPQQHGLRIACVSADAQVRIYEAIEPNDLARWTLTHEFAVLETSPPRGVDKSFCLSWSLSPGDGQQLLIGAMDRAGIWRLDDKSNLWIPGEQLEGHSDLVRSVAWGRSMGKSYQLLATGSRDHFVRIYQLVEIDSHDYDGNTTENEDNMNTEDLFMHSSSFAGGQTGAAAHNSNANKSGTSGKARATIGAAEADEEGPKFFVDRIASFDDHKAQVWKVAFNVTGTILSSAGDDGCIRLWKASYAHKFQCICTISMEAAANEAADNAEDLKASGSQAPNVIV